MALQLDLTAETCPLGMAVTECYARVTNGAFNDDCIRFIVSYFGNHAAREAAKPPLYSKEFVISLPDYSVGISKTDLYNYLKTLPEFAGAIDV